MAKAQISSEFVVVVAVVIFMFLGFLLFYLDKRPELDKADILLDLRNECFKISDALGSAVTLGDGYNQKLTTRNTITIQSGTINVKLTDRADINTGCSYRGDVVQSQFTGTVIISNNNGNIIIQNV